MSCALRDLAGSAGASWLDSQAKQDSNACMKGRLWLSSVLWLVAIQVMQAQQNIEAGSTPGTSTALRAGITDLPIEANATQTNAIVRKGVTVSGPLVQPFKSK